MNYLFLAEDFLDHPKFVRANDRASSSAIHLWIGLMSYCKTHQTDGVVPLSMVSRVHGPVPRWRRRALDALVFAELVDVTEDSVMVRDYLQWNFSKAEIKRRADVKKGHRPGASEPPPARSERSSERMPERRSERVASVVPTVAPTVVSNVERASLLSQPVSNDTGELDSVVGAPDAADGAPPASRAQARSGSGSGSGDLGSPPVVPPSLVLEPPAQTASTSSARPRKVRKKRDRTECPPDFKPDDESMAKARELGFSAAQELECRREFVRYWRVENGSAKADWQGTYQNRLTTRAAQLGLEPPKPETPADRAWRERKAAAERVPEHVARGARERLSGVKGAIGEQLFART